MNLVDFVNYLKLIQLCHSERVLEIRFVAPVARMKTQDTPSDGFRELSVSYFRYVVLICGNLPHINRLLELLKYVLRYISSCIELVLLNLAFFQQSLGIFYIFFRRTQLVTW